LGADEGYDASIRQTPVAVGSEQDTVGYLNVDCGASDASPERPVCIDGEAHEVISCLLARGRPDGSDRPLKRDQAVGTVHFWLVAPVHVQIWSSAPSAVLLSLMSRHLPEPVLTRS
jgi:hypothetical protein